MITLYLLNRGSTIVSLNSIPSVRYFILVLVGDDRSSNLMAYPTSSPNTVPTSSATLVATLVAATLLGWVQATTLLFDAHPASCRYCGISTASPLAPYLQTDAVSLRAPRPIMSMTHGSISHIQSVRPQSPPCTSLHTIIAFADVYRSVNALFGNPSSDEPYWG